MLCAPDVDRDRLAFAVFQGLPGAEPGVLGGCGRWQRGPVEADTEVKERLDARMERGRPRGDAHNVVTTLGRLVRQA